MSGVRLQVLHPGLAMRDCGHCQQVLYDEETGKPEMNRAGGERLRDASCPPPCRTSRGCKKGTPEHSLALSEQNLQAWLHYRECRAVGSFPDDAIVRHNAMLIREVEDAIERQRELEFQTALLIAKGQGH
jgi:hypothetical protein